jgi:hypothetical protein
MRKQVMHPTKPDILTVIGTDRALGVFVNVERKGRLVGEYDALRPGYDGVPGALAFLAKKGFFSHAASGLALAWVQHSLAAESDDAEIRFAGELAEYLCSAGS